MSEITLYGDQPEWLVISTKRISYPHGEIIHPKNTHSYLVDGVLYVTQTKAAEAIGCHRDALRAAISKGHAHIKGHEVVEVRSA